MADEWTSTIDLGPAVAAIDAGGRAGLEKVLDRVLAGSQRLVSVDTGELRASGRVQMSGTEGAVFYTDSKAVGAHEDLRGRNKTGQAKFLEQPLMDAPSAKAETIAAEIRSRLGT